MFSEVRTVFGRPLPGFLTTADPVSSTRLKIACTVFTFHCFGGYFEILTDKSHTVAEKLHFVWWGILI